MLGESTVHIGAGIGKQGLELLCQAITTSLFLASLSSAIHSSKTNWWWDSISVKASPIPAFSPE